MQDAAPVVAGSLGKMTNVVVVGIDKDQGLVLGRYASVRIFQSCSPGEIASVR